MSMETEATDAEDAATPNEMNYIERVQFYREDVHSSLSDQYDTLLSKGCVPRHAVGVLHYIAGQLDIAGRMTQCEVATRYDMTEVTVRKWVDEIETDLPPLAKDTRTQTESSQSPSRPPVASEQSSSKSPAATREIYYILHTASEPALLTKTIIERSEYSSGYVRDCLRALAAAEVVGARYTKRSTHSRCKEWWAVSRQDTPDYRYDCHEGPSKTQLLDRLGEKLGWEKRKTWRSSETAEYTSESITHQGFEDLTSEQTTILQTIQIATQFGLRLGEDMNLQLSVNKPGVEKLADAFFESEDGTVEDVKPTE